MGMNRRSALFLSLCLGGLLPRRLLAQSPGTQTPTRRTPNTKPARRASDASTEAAADDPASATSVETDSPPADFPTETGFQWRRFDISKYTSLDHTLQNPQTAIIEWVFRRTESAPWHADRIAVLSATRAQLTAYNSPKVLDQVSEMVERFTDSTADVLSVRVRFVAAADTRWRYAVSSRLNLVGNGPQGQQIWTLKVEDAAMVLTQMQVYQGFHVITDKKFDMINGQTIFMQSTVNRNYVAGLQRDAGGGVGLQQAVKALEEGVVLRLSPLLSYEGDTLDAALELRVNTIRSLHRTTVIAPREVGPSELTIDVPEVSETRLNQNVRSWPLGQTLLVSAGIHPGILGPKTGLLNLRIPGTYPTSTELLAFVDVEIGDKPAPRTTRNRTRNRE
jgi:hypothetical protein